MEELHLYAARVRVVEAMEQGLPWHEELALLTGRARPYSYRHTKRFLLRLSAAQADQALTDALARWTAAKWQVEERSPDWPIRPAHEIYNAKRMLPGSHDVERVGNRSSRSGSRLLPAYTADDRCHMTRSARFCSLPAYKP